MCVEANTPLDVGHHLLSTICSLLHVPFCRLMDHSCSCSCSASPLLHRLLMARVAQALGLDKPLQHEGQSVVPPSISSSIPMLLLPSSLVWFQANALVLLPISKREREKKLISFWSSRIIALFYFDLFSDGGLWVILEHQCSCKSFSTPP